MAKRRCWGIYRERPHSPGRVDDDAAILDAVAVALPDYDLVAEVLPAGAAGAAFASPGAGIFAMCEQDGIIRRLAEAAQAGVPVVNTPQAVRNTYRRRTAELFALWSVPSPVSRIVDTRAPAAAPGTPVWIKRPDFHATQTGDVVFADSDAQWRSALAGFAKRGIDAVVVQAHIPGDLVKFYGVAGGGADPAWFHWFYHKDQRLAGHPFTREALQRAAFAAAGALGAEVFGGDAIVGADGAPQIIDLNAWPSFALCRAEAAAAIARHLARAFAAARLDSPFAASEME
jgi:hypothetical protein